MSLTVQSACRKPKNGAEARGGAVPRGALASSPATIKTRSVISLQAWEKSDASRCAETDMTTHYFVLSTRDFRDSDPAYNAGIATFVNGIFATEDKPMLEAQQARLGTSPRAARM